MPDWEPQKYLQFADERTRPARDLLAQVPVAEARLVYDLGCGPGNSTELLVARYPQAKVIGVDNSPAMIATAHKAVPQAEFVEADLATWAPPADADLLYSNATLQWLPDHARLLQSWVHLLRRGSVLAVQMPDNLDEPSHALMRKTAENGPWADKLREASGARALLPSPQAYYNALKPHCARVDIWHTVYNHPLAGAAAIAAWLKTTGLRPFLAPLDETEQQAFLSDYQGRLAKAYPMAIDRKCLLRFPRLFIVAVK